MYYSKETPLEDMVGKTLVSAEKIYSANGDEIVFKVDTGETYRLFHEQDCCENVSIDDIVGDLADLVGTPIVISRYDTNVPKEPRDPEDASESYSWSFYNFATVKGYVTVRWYGTSNGYYSEGVSFYEDSDLVGSEDETYN